jgi:hypothetical protein
MQVSYARTRIGVTRLADGFVSRKELVPGFPAGALLPDLSNAFRSSVELPCQIPRR